MNKTNGHIIVMAMAALIAAACSHDSDIEPGGGGDVPVVGDGTPIALSTNQQPETVVTRAGLEEKGVTDFTVFGYKNFENANGSYGTRQTVFPGYTVSWTANSANTSTTNTNSWEYVDEATEQTIKYWDWGASAYRFFGVTGSVNSGIGTGTRGKYGTYGDGAYETYELTITADGSTTDAINATPYISHLWFSTGMLPDYSDRQFGKPVQLEFLKPLSTVRFMFTFEDPKDAATTMLTQKSFRPTNGSIIKTRGDITISYPLTGPTTKEWFTYLPGEGGLTDFTQDYYEEVEVLGEHVVKPYFDAPDSLCNYIYTVLPASNQGTYTLSVSVNGDPKTTVVPAEFMDWKLGYLYTYIFKIHVDGSVKIETVQSAFTEWREYSTDYTIYNW